MCEEAGEAQDWMCRMVGMVYNLTMVKCITCMHGTCSFGESLESTGSKTQCTVCHVSVQLQIGYIHTVQPVPCNRTPSIYQLQKAGSPNTV